MRVQFPQRIHSATAVLICIAVAGRATSAELSKSAGAFSREHVLRDIAQEVIAPGYVELASKCRDLTNSVGQLTETTNQTSLDAARKAWLATAEAANRLRCFQIGPVADHDSASTFYYWQVMPDHLEAVLRDSSRAIDLRLIDEAGSTTKGLYALEYLLFDRKGGQATEPMEPAKALDLLSATPRRRDYLLAAARDVEAKAAQLAKDWTATGPEGATPKFIAGGQDSINALVNQLCQSIETTTEKRLHFVTVLPNPISHQLFRIEGARSGSSLEGVIATLEGISRIYRGCDGMGLESAVENLNPALAHRVQEGCDAALAASREIGAPLEQAVVARREAIKDAAEKTHALEILFKVDLTSALGVTLTFTSGDGD